MAENTVSTYVVKDTTNSKETTSNKTFELTKYLITGKTISNEFSSNSISSMTISFNVANEYKGYHKVNFYIVIGSLGTFSSPYQTNIYGNGNYTRVTLTIPLNTNNDNGINVLDYNQYINNSQVRLFMSVTRTSGSGTLHYRGDVGADPYIIYNLGDGINFSEPLPNSEIKQYTNLEAVIENVQVGEYSIYIDGKEKDTKEVFNIETQEGSRIDYSKSIGSLEPGDYTLVCKKNNISVCSVQFKVIKNQIFSIIPEINRYEYNNNSYESSFNGEYIGLKLNITTLISEFINKRYNIILTYSSNNVDKPINFNDTLLTQQIILDVFSLDGTTKPQILTSTSVKIVINDNNGNSIYSANIPISDPSVIFNIEENGISVGMLSHMKNQFESAWPAIFYDSIYLTEKNGNETTYYKLYIDNHQLAVTQENPFSNS